VYDHPISISYDEINRFQSEENRKMSEENSNEPPQEEKLSSNKPEEEEDEGESEVVKEEESTATFVPVVCNFLETIFISFWGDISNETGFSHEIFSHSTRHCFIFPLFSRLRWRRWKSKVVKKMRYVTSLCVLSVVYICLSNVTPTHTSCIE
jgi:hypothetical protein